MSLSWRERILVALEPGRAHAVRLRNSERRTAATPKEALAGWPRADVTIVASNRLVRYVVVPRTAGLSGEAEELGLARHHFNRVYGDRVRDWDVRFSRATGLASAVDQAMVDQLKEELKPHRLVSLQPYLMTSFNRLRKRVPRGGAWIVVPEAEATCVALFAKGAWAGVSVSRAPSDEALERERVRMGGAGAPDTVLMQPAGDGYAMALSAR